MRWRTCPTIRQKAACSMSFRCLSAVCCFLVVTGCERERRDLRPAPASLTVYSDAVRQSELQPGGRQSQSLVTNPYKGNAYAISEGQRLYGWDNSCGRHAEGSGGL